MDLRLRRTNRRLDTAVVPEVGGVWALCPSIAVVPAHNGESWLQERDARSASFKARYLQAPVAQGVSNVPESSSFAGSFQLALVQAGGATHGYWQDVSLSLLAPHGGWNTEEGLKAYAAASFSQRLSVTQRM